LQNFLATKTKPGTVSDRREVPHSKTDAPPLKARSWPTSIVRRPQIAVACGSLLSLWLWQLAMGRWRTTRTRHCSGAAVRMAFALAATRLRAALMYAMRHA